MSNFVKTQIKAPASSMVKPAPSHFQTRPFGTEAEPTRPTRPASGGHSFGAVCVHRSAPLIVQPKLRLGPAKDKYEEEADRVANQVVSGTNVFTQGIGVIVRREPDIQPISASIPAPIVDPNVEGGIHSKQKSGQSLPEDMRVSMEQSFGVDFTKVRVHSDTTADTLSRSLAAHAFTVGSDIFFARGAFNMASTKGKKLLAHELTHVVQQSRSTASPNFVSERLTPVVIQRDVNTELTKAKEFMDKTQKVKGSFDDEESNIRADTTSDAEERAIGLRHWAAHLAIATKGSKREIRRAIQLRREGKVCFLGADNKKEPDIITKGEKKTDKATLFRVEETKNVTSDLPTAVEANFKKSLNQVHKLRASTVPNRIDNTTPNFEEWKLGIYISSSQNPWPYTKIDDACGKSVEAIKKQVKRRVDDTPIEVKSTESRPNVITMFSGVKQFGVDGKPIGKLDLHVESKITSKNKGKAKTKDSTVTFVKKQKVTSITPNPMDVDFEAASTPPNTSKYDE